MARRAKREIRDPKEFYADALSRADRVRLSKARELEGIDEEIALLRMKLRQLLEEHPDKVDLLFKGVNLLQRAVVSRYKLSPKAGDDLYQSIVGVLNGIGRELWPEGANGVEEA